jgi:hypothetical protein
MRILLENVNQTGYTFSQLGYTFAIVLPPSMPICLMTLGAFPRTSLARLSSPRTGKATAEGAIMPGVWFLAKHNCSFSEMTKLKLRKYNPKLLIY